MLLKHPEIGKHVVPIIPDEARTFGMESLFRQFGIYASQGQLYEPHDADMFLYYKEAKDGQILEEGITEAGSMASFTAAGTAYANHGVQMIPFFIYYSMFGFQRVGDLIWAFADARGKGFLWAAPPGAPRSPAKACSTRTATASCSPAPSRPARLRSRVRLRDRGHRAGRHPAHVPGAGGPLLLPHPVQRELRDAARCRRVSRKASCAGIYKFKAGDKRQGAASSSSAAARS